MYVEIRLELITSIMLAAAYDPMHMIPTTSQYKGTQWQQKIQDCSIIHVKTSGSDVFSKLRVFRQSAHLKDPTFLNIWIGNTWHVVV